MQGQKSGLKKYLRRSKTITVSDFTQTDSKKTGEVTFVDDGTTGDPNPSPPLKPTSSCQALRHAVSALTRIDDFILEELGDGFFANVYKATHRVTGEEMVMKINKDLANRASALREVQLMNKLSHPNILRFLGVCVHEGQLHALTEYIDGGTLEELLMAHDEELPWTLRIKLSLDIARAMRYLHMEGVFHRDLTSKNILIKKGENKHYQAIVADFGLATKIPDPTSLEPLPSVGCPWWMAPEVINAKFYDERADLFSYGIICLEIAARIDADPDTMPRTQKFGVDYVKFVELVDYCPLDYLQLAFKCCQVLPEKRPTSNTIISTLEQIYRTLKTNPSSTSARLHKRSRSEDNIISSESFLSTEEGLVTPQIIAQAMSRNDPHYSPADVNPFAAISKFKDGRKLLDFTGSRKGSSSGGSSSGLSGGGGYARRRNPSTGEHHHQKSQSLPCSPEMLRRAAEKLHQASLHGSEVVEEEDSQVEVESSQSSDHQDHVGDEPDRRAAFGTSRTRSLGALDFWNPLACQSRLAGRVPVLGQPHRAAGRRDREDTSDIAEASFEDCLSSEVPTSPDLLEDLSLYSDCEPNNNNSVTAYESCCSDSEDCNLIHPRSSFSLSSCSLSSCGEDNKQPHEKEPLEEEMHDKPPIATESGSFNGDHFGKAANGHVKTSLSHC